MLREQPLNGVHLLTNHRFRERMPYPARLVRTFNRAEVEAATAEISRWPDYRRTPLHSLAGIAAELGVGSVHYKDEADRFGLQSAGALGAAYAVLKLLQRLQQAVGGASAPTFADLASGGRRDVTLCCAAGGSHGRAVAWSAARLGTACVIFLHEGVGQPEKAAIERHGARIVQVPGTHEDSVREAAEQAARNGWHLISDMPPPGSEAWLEDAMAGYAVMVEEALADCPAAPTHIFIQGGAGGLAAAVAAHAWSRLGARYPGVVVVEPDRAPCLFLSARAGHPVAVDGPLDTAIAELARGEAPEVDREVLELAASHFLTVTDADAVDAVRALAQGAPPVTVGESGAAGLAGLMVAATRPDLRQTLRLGPQSRVLLFGTDGAASKT